MIIDIIAIIKLLVAAAKEIESVTSAADKGAYKRSTIFPCIFPIIKVDDEWEKDCCITCMAIKPGAKNVINGTPNTSPLSDPIANDKTSKNKRDEVNGEKIVWIQTIRNLKTSYWYNVQAPVQFIKPNLLFPILYFFVISTIDSLITLNLRKLCKTNTINRLNSF